MLHVIKQDMPLDSVKQMIQYFKEEVMNIADYTNLNPFRVILWMQ